MEEPIIEVNKKDIVKQAINIVDSTNKNLLVTTCLIKEEFKISKEYYKALLKALDRGVTIKRICFGSSSMYKVYAKSVDKRVRLFLITKEHLYQRMLLSDNSSLLFRLGNSFLKSKNLLVIQAIKRYIDDVIGFKI